MMNNIKVKESTMVHPNVETPRHSIPLPTLDSVLRLPYSHTPLLYIYSAKVHPTENHHKNFGTNLMRSSLSRALGHFYPLAGRLQYNKRNNVLEIDCNGKGVVFIEAETTYGFDDFGEFSPSDELRNVTFPAPCDYSEGLSSFPLLMVQLTRFKCGGVTIGFLVHHNVQDGVAMAHFVNSWSQIAMGVELDCLPFHNRMSCLAPRHPPRVMFRHLEYEPPLPPIRISGNSEASNSTTTTCELFKFSKQQITTLKRKATSQEARHRLSTYAAMAAHVWRCVCKARGLPNHQQVRLYMPINGRSRLDAPKLPQGYFGNVLFRGICIAKAGDVACQPLSHTANMVQEALLRMNNEYLRSAIDYLGLNPQLSGINPSLLWMHQEKNPNLSVNSWSGIPYHEADFGWGRPSFIRLGGVGYEGQTLIMPSLNGDGSLSISINLSVSHMTVFKKYIYGFVDVHASL